MIIHLIGSMRQFDEDVVFMSKIADTLQKNTINLAYDWFSAVHDRRERGSTKEGQLNWSDIVKDNVDAVIRADALIIEGSRFGYSQAYQTAIALQYNKPVLNLYRMNLPEYTEWPDKLFVSGIENPLFHNVAYENADDLPNIVEQFINDIPQKLVEIDAKIVIDQDVLRYIESLSDATGRSKNGVIKDIIVREARLKAKQRIAKIT